MCGSVGARLLQPVVRVRLLLLLLLQVAGPRWRGIALRLVRKPKSQDSDREEWLHERRLNKTPIWRLHRPRLPRQQLRLPSSRRHGIKTQVSRRPISVVFPAVLPVILPAVLPVVLPAVPNDESKPSALCHSQWRSDE